MSLLDRLMFLSVLDAAAVAFLLTGWLGIGYLIENPGKRKPSVTVIMAQYRRDWMREMAARDVRIFDAQMLANLRQGTSFFASTCVLAIGGVLALVGNTERLLGVASDLTLAEAPSVIWELKLMVVALFLTMGFLKFVWANRLFGYCAVVMGAVPNDPSDPLAAVRGAQAAEINIRAAWNFNRGLRAMYFSLATLAWLLGPAALILATCATLYTIWDREFASVSRRILTDPQGPGR